MGAINRYAAATMLAAATVLSVAGTVGDSAGKAAEWVSAGANDSDLVWCPDSMVWDGHKCTLSP
jgi:hypothetical protein